MSWNKWIVSVTILASVLFLGACSESEQVEPLMQEELMTTDEVKYYTAQVEKSDYVTSVSGAVSAVYLMRTDLSLEQSNARFNESFVKMGQQVKEGDVLMTFDIEESEAELASLKLQLQRKKEDTDAEAAEKLALINYEKTQTEELQDEKLQIANLKIEKMQAQYEQFLYQAELVMSDLEEKIAALEKAQSENTLTAPYDGVIDSVVVLSKGDKIMPGQVLISMHANDKMLLQTTNTANRLRYNMPVTIEVSNRNSEQTFTGKVVVAPNILPISVAQDLMLIELDDPVTEEQLVGTIKYYTTIEEVKNVLVVNEAAVNVENETSYVNILEDNILKKRYVETYSNIRSGMVWILDGLTEGQTVILD